LTRALSWQSSILHHACNWHDGYCAGWKAGTDALQQDWLAWIASDRSSREEDFKAGWHWGAGATRDLWLQWAYRQKNMRQTAWADGFDAASQDHTEHGTNTPSLPTLSQDLHHALRHVLGAKKRNGVWASALSRLGIQRRCHYIVLSRRESMEEAENGSSTLKKSMDSGS
jgi:hypothetical protein